MNAEPASQRPYNDPLAYIAYAIDRPLAQARTFLQLGTSDDAFRALYALTDAVTEAQSALHYTAAELVRGYIAESLPEATTLVLLEGKEELSPVTIRNAQGENIWFPGAE